MSACPSCGTENAPVARWCARCGIYLADSRIGHLARPIRRLYANFLDLCIFLGMVVLTIAPGAVTGVIAGSAGQSGGGEPGVLVPLLVGTFMVLGFAGFLAYIVWALVLFGSRGMTPGKKVVGIRVIQDDGSVPSFFTMLVREWAAKWVSSLAFGIGFVWVLFDRDKQGWHDKLMSTYVVE